MEIAKWIVTVVALSGFGGVLADAIIPQTARQHLRNPAWPPHAKFHNGQTMLMGIGQGLLSLAILFGFHPLTFSLFLVATAAAGSYYIAMVLAPMFPGTAWSDPEFKGTFRRPLGLHPQQLLGYFACALLALAVVLAAG